MSKAQNTSDNTPAKPKGRPSKLTPEIVTEIMLRLAHGEPLARICADEHMPDFSTVWRWEEQDEEFRNLSARARAYGTHYLADDCIRIADDEEIDPADKRVRIDTRLRLIGKWNRKDYGERQEIDAKLRVERKQTFDPRLLSPEEREQIESILQQAMARQLAGPDVIEGEFSEVPDE